MVEVKRVPYMSTTHGTRASGSIFTAGFTSGTVHSPTGAMVLPPYEGLAKISGDEETHFSGCEAVVSQFAIMVKIGHDGLG